ncbi:hypothetical protein PybrP1_005047 [[Pythium] brassicae (nom. inval.)]|nr:hypothetical protein PybrP1_005047 [[Pythium] brassicae (nom. inval.)]
MTTGPSVSTAKEASDDEDESPQSDDEQQRDEAPTAPYTSLVARARVLEQVVAGWSPRRNSLLGRRGSSENNAAPLELGGQLPRPSSKAARSFRTSFALTTGDDGLDDLVKNISSEGTDRCTLVLRAALAVWERHRPAAALRRWKEILRVRSDPLLVRSEDVNDEARRILLAAESARVASENAAATAAAAVAARAGSSADSAVAVKFARRDLDVLVVWARQLQAKTFPAGVDDTSVREAMKYLRFRQYEDGEALFFEGEVGDTFYFVFQGTVAVYVGASKAQRQRVQEGVAGAGRRGAARLQGKPDVAQLGARVFAYRTGEGFGETAMFTADAVRTASAVAAGACAVCELPKEVYRRTLKKAHQQFFAQAQKVNFLQRVALFRDWQRGRLGAVADVLEKRKLAFGDALLVEGALAPPACFFVLSGLVTLTQQLAVGAAPLSPRPSRHRGAGVRRSVELQTLGVADIVGLDALVELTARAAYSAVAASASVELYVLKEADARGLLGGAQSAFSQRVRETCALERSAHDARLANARLALLAHEALAQDAELLRSRDDSVESARSEQAARAALAARAEATLQATSGATAASPLGVRGAAPYLPHLRATNLLELAPAPPFVPLAAASRVEHEALGAVAAPKMLSLCAKNFVFANANALASDYPARLRLSFPPAPVANRALVERITTLMAPVCPTSGLAAQASASPRRAARRVVPTIERRDDQHVLEQQLARLQDAKMHWDAARRDFVLLPPTSSAPARGAALAAAPPAVRQTALHHELRATQESARRLVEDHLRKNGCAGFLGAIAIFVDPDGCAGAVLLAPPVGRFPNADPSENAPV